MAGGYPEVALAIRGGRVVTMDALRTVVDADVLVNAAGRIVALAAPGNSDDAQVHGRASAERVIDASGMLVVPGLVQAHPEDLHAPPLFAIGTRPAAPKSTKGAHCEGRACGLGE